MYITNLLARRGAAFSGMNQGALARIFPKPSLTAGVNKYTGDGTRGKAQ